MSNRISERDLHRLIERVNAMSGVGELAGPLTPGALRLGSAYGGYRLEMVVSTSGGITTPGVHHYRPRREVYNELRGIVVGMYLQSEVRYITTKEG